MWSRVVEAMLGCWLMVSPFIFKHPSDQIALWANDFACGAAVILFSLLSYWSPTRHAHVLTIAVAVWLVGFAYWIGFGNPVPAAQNDLVLGLLLAMFAIIPNDAERPAASWDDPTQTLSSE